MGHYIVTWSIDSFCDTPEEAAKESWEFMRDPDTHASILEVAEFDKVRLTVKDPVHIDMRTLLGKEF